MTESTGQAATPEGMDQADKRQANGKAYTAPRLTCGTPTEMSSTASTRQVSQKWASSGSRGRPRRKLLSTTIEELLVQYPDLSERLAERLLTSQA